MATRGRTAQSQSRTRGTKAELRRKAELIEGVMKLIDEHEDEDGSLPKGTIKRIVQQEKNHLSWLTENQIYSLRKRRRENKHHNEKMAREAEMFDTDSGSDLSKDFAKLEVNDDSATSDDEIFNRSFDSRDSDLHLQYTMNIIATVDPDAPPSGDIAIVPAVVFPFNSDNGCPTGTTIKQKEEILKKHQILRDDIASTWYNIRQQNTYEENNLQLWELIVLKKQEQNLPRAIVPETTIRSRLIRGNLMNDHDSTTTAVSRKYQRVANNNFFKKVHVSVVRV